MEEKKNGLEPLNQSETKCLGSTDYCITPELIGQLFARINEANNVGTAKHPYVIATDFPGFCNVTVYWRDRANDGDDDYFGVFYFDHRDSAGFEKSIKAIEYVKKARLEDEQIVD